MTHSVSIIVPVKNGLPYFAEVCEALKRQDYDGPVEVICIDSGSTDGSDRIAEQHGFRLVRIKPKDFGHGRTRNYGASLSNSTYIAFITHDAVPHDEHWLTRLIAPMRADPQVAGVFSRHIAHDGADPFTQRDLQMHFDGLAKWPVVQITDRAAYDADQGLRQVYHYYSDNASAMPRRIWKKFPYPDVQFAEDQIWAKTIVEAGYKKAFAQDSIVRHSHAFKTWETLRRSFDESRAFNRLFGYVLAPSMKNVLRSTAYLWKRDIGAAFTNGWWKSHPGMTLSRIGQSFTRPLGHYLGAKRNLPRLVEASLSRDEWIRNLTNTEQVSASMFTKFSRHARTHGVGSAIRASIRYVARGPMQDPQAQLPYPVSQKSKGIDAIGFCNSFLGHPHGDIADLATAKAKTMQWVIPNFGFGSGGHLNIFRFINMMAASGYKQRLVILPPYNWSSPEDARASLEQWYMPLDAEIALGVEGFAPSHITLATGWQTAYWVAKHQASQQKFYFIQDFEPSFYSVSTEYYLAENTYRLGLKGITAGTWLSEKLSREYGMTCGAVSFGVELDRYKPTIRREHPHFNIFFYSRHVTRRRLFELGLAALSRVTQMHPNVAVIFAGGDVSGYDIPFPHLNAGELRLDELPDLYTQSDLALVLSGTNLSLLPLELAACKCPMVMNDTPSARWLMPEDACYYAPTDPDGMAATISRAITDDADRNRRMMKAHKISSSATWAKQGKQFLKLVKEMAK